MTPSKDWMTIDDYISDEYKAGVDSFLDYAFQKLGTVTIRCPCCKCLNIESGNREEVREHLLVYGIVKRYTFWYHHGERLDECESLSSGDVNMEGDEGQDETIDILRDLYPQYSDFNSIDVDHVEEPNDDVKRFYQLLKDSQERVYEGCKSSRLSALLKLLHIKTLGRWSNESFTMLLEFLKTELLPERSKLPDSYYESKKTMKDLGLSYQKIDACVNDCMLYWRENEDLDACKVCGASRWKCNKRTGEDKSKKNGKRIPEKTLRYFPLIPRLQRLYMCSKTAALMRWMKPKLVDIFHSTRKKGTSLPNVETAKKLDEIRETMEKDPSLSDVQIAQKVFNSKSRDRVVGFGGGMKVADLRGQRPSREELEAELNSTKKQNQILEDRMEAIQDENNQLKGRIGSVESQMKMFQDMLVNQLNVTLTPEN